MAELPILQLDIKKLCVDYLKTNRIVVNENDVNVIRRSLAVKHEDGIWREPVNNDGNTTVTVKFVNHRAEQGEFGNRRVIQDDTMASVYVQGQDNFCRITIDNLVITGLPEAKIRLPMHVQELRGEFGKYFDIDPCTGIFEQTRNIQRDPAPTVNEIRLENELTTARIQRRKKEVTYMFQCTVVMDALVGIRLSSGWHQIEFAAVVKALKLENNPQYRFLDSVSVRGTRVEFPLSGTGEFRWQCHDNITWS